MDERLRSIIIDLRKRSSEEASDWIMKQYPTTTPHWGEAINIISHLSWKKSDQVRLAEYYLREMPFASARAYEVFSSFMNLPRLVEIMRRFIPIDKGRRQLLEYHAVPVLRRAAKTPEDQEVVRNFVDELKAE